MTTPNTTATPPGGLLLEIITTRPQANPTGIRVYADGRYEELGDTIIDVAADGSSSVRPAELAWRPVLTYTTTEMEALRQALRAANLPALQPRYTSSASRTGTNQTWRIWLDGAEYTTTIEQYPTTRVPALDTVYQQLHSLRPLPPSTSEWAIWNAGVVQTHQVGCDASSVEELKALIQAIFAPGSAQTPAELPDIQADTVLIDVHWLEQGQPGERTIVYGDGRVVGEQNGQTTLLRTLSEPQLRALLDAAASVDWKKVC